MNIQMLLSKKVKEAEPTLDVSGSDRKILQVACQDFTNYLKVHWNLTGKEESNLELTEKIEQFYKKDCVEFEEFLAIWVGMWLKKWKQRVKLIIGNQPSIQDKLDLASKIAPDVDILWRKLEGKQLITELVVFTLIKNAEICGTELIAENLLKTELHKNANLDISNKGQVVALLNNTLRSARALSQNVGPIVFVKVDKGYYGAVTA